MPDQLPPLKKDEKVIISDKFELIGQDLYKALINFLNFTVPIYAFTFFGLLAMGVAADKAALAALASLWGPLRDLAGKYVQKDRYIVPKE